MEGKVGGRSWGVVAMDGIFDVIASVICVVNSNVIGGRVACVLKENI